MSPGDGSLWGGAEAGQLSGLHIPEQQDSCPCWWPGLHGSSGLEHTIASLMWNRRPRDPQTALLSHELWLFSEATVLPQPTDTTCPTPCRQHTDSFSIPQLILSCGSPGPSFSLLPSPFHILSSPHLYCLGPGSPKETPYPWELNWSWVGPLLGSRWRRWQGRFPAPAWRPAYVATDCVESSHGLGSSFKKQKSPSQKHHETRRWATVLLQPGQLRTAEVSQPQLRVAKGVDVRVLEEPSTFKASHLKGAWSEFLWLRHICFCWEGQVCQGLGETRWQRRALEMSQTPRVTAEPWGKDTAFVSVPYPLPQAGFHLTFDTYQKTVELEDWNYEKNIKMSFVH